MRISTRNQFKGQATVLRIGPVNADVSVDIGGGDQIDALVTTKSLEVWAFATASKVRAAQGIVGHGHEWVRAAEAQRPQPVAGQCNPLQERRDQRRGDDQLPGGGTVTRHRHQQELRRPGTPRKASRRSPCSNPPASCSAWSRKRAFAENVIIRLPCRQPGSMRPLTDARPHKS